MHSHETIIIIYAINISITSKGLLLTSLFIIISFFLIRTVNMRSTVSKILSIQYSIVNYRYYVVQ